MQRLFDRFDRVLNDRGYLAMGGQIVDATVIEAQRPRLNTAEKATINGCRSTGRRRSARKLTATAAGP